MPVGQSRFWDVSIEIKIGGIFDNRAVEGALLPGLSMRGVDALPATSGNHTIMQASA